MHGTLILLAATLTLSSATHREPQFPLKTDRVIYTDEAIRQARDNIAKFPAAKKLADGTVAAGDAWLEWPDEELRGLIPTADVPRAFNVGTAGCPVCGTAIYAKGGTYPWVLDLKRPFKVECPVCGGVFPDNDFKAYYDSGLQDEQFLEGKYADDGWGWVSEEGERYWLVGYANHWTLHSHVLPGIGDLAMAYLFTGDRRYAHKAAAMLDRAAEVYPDMDYHNQSRYGQLVAKDGGHYHGKFVNLIWATGRLTDMAAAYDAIWETIDADAALQDATGKTGEEIRANIEANLLEEGIDCIFAEKIRGNYAMHQRALVYSALARQHGDTEAWLDTIFTRTGCSAHYTGLNYALYNLVYRDGVPYETSPGYNSGWVRRIAQIARTLEHTGRDVYAMPKTKRLFDGMLDVINIGKFTPATGDSGSVYGGMVTDSGTFQGAYRACKDPRYLAHLSELGAVGGNTFQTRTSLFRPPIEASDAKPGPQRPRLLDGYGMGILNNPADTISVAVYYGYKGGHGHFDRLNFEMFAHGTPIMPDTGYPDFMNGYVPGIYTWSKNTIAHNAVVVDEGRQRGNQAGTVRLFADGEWARTLDVDAPETYPQCATYRRHLTMVDVDAERSYFVDFFTAEGGSQHDYSLHGPPGTCQVKGGAWAKQEAGTLAGEDVELAQLYDDPAMGAEGFSGTYYGYTGSGFQHLFNVQRLEEGEWLAEYAHERHPEAGLRLRVLVQSGTEIILADAQVSPVKHKQLLKYVIARRKGEGLKSRFAAVIEPFKGEPFIEGASRVELDDGATALAIRRKGGQTDIVVHNPDRAEVRVRDVGIATDAMTAVVTLNARNEPARVFFANGAALSVGDERFSAPACPSGQVVSVKPGAREIRVHAEGVPEGFDARSLAGRVVHFENAIRRTAHPVAAAELDGGELVLTTRDDILAGRARVTAVEADALRTDTAFMFAPVYRGAYVSDADFTAFYPIAGVDTPEGGESAIRMAPPLPEDNPFETGADIWIVNVGVEDKLDVPSVFHWAPR